MSRKRARIVAATSAIYLACISTTSNAGEEGPYWKFKSNVPAGFAGPESEGMMFEFLANKQGQIAGFSIIPQKVEISASREIRGTNCQIVCIGTPPNQFYIVEGCPSPQGDIPDVFSFKLESKPGEDGVGFELQLQEPLSPKIYRQQIPGLIFNETSLPQKKVSE